MAEAIVALQAVGETVDRIAELCGTTTTEVRRLRRLIGGESGEEPAATSAVTVGDVPLPAQRDDEAIAEAR